MRESATMPKRKRRRKMKEDWHLSYSRLFSCMVGVVRRV
jgi:hypothetical protein